MSVAVFGRALGIDDVMVARAGAVMMVLFGIVLLIPQFSARFATVTAGMSARADAGMDSLNRDGLGGSLSGVRCSGLFGCHVLVQPWGVRLLWLLLAKA